MQITDTQTTAFEIPGFGVVPYSARGLDCSYAPVENGKLTYDLRGVLHSSSRSELDLFEVSVSCEDNWPPGFAGLWRSWTGPIHGTPDFVQPASLAQVRPSADGVLTWMDAGMNVLPGNAGAAWLSYRPVMQVRLVDWNFKPNEYGAITNWSIKFRETR